MFDAENCLNYTILSYNVYSENWILLMKKKWKNKNVEKKTKILKKRKLKKWKSWTKGKFVKKKENLQIKEN